MEVQEASSVKAASVSVVIAVLILLIKNDRIHFVLSSICINFVVIMKTRTLFNSLFIVAWAAMSLGVAVSCKEKPRTTDIIVNKSTPKPKKGVQKMDEYRQVRDVEWLGGTYKVVAERKPDTSLPQAVDEQGNRYYDNRITLTISRPDGTAFFNRTFSKTDFAKYVDGDNADGALLGIVFDRADGASLIFAASVGSPDKMSDEYVPLVMTISRGGTVSIAKDTQLDTVSDAADEADDEDGV